MLNIDERDWYTRVPNLTRVNAFRTIRCTFVCHHRIRIFLIDKTNQTWHCNGSSWRCCESRRDLMQSILLCHRINANSNKTKARESIVLTHLSAWWRTGDDKKRNTFSCLLWFYLRWDKLWAHEKKRQKKHVFSLFSQFVCARFFAYFFSALFLFLVHFLRFIGCSSTQFFLFFQPQPTISSMTSAELFYKEFWMSTYKFS